MNLEMKKARVAIVVPALNESEVIAGVVTCISVYGKAIVVDDGSSDNTGQLAQEAGAIVISHEINRGYDKALASGLEKAVADAFDFAITVDGDGQHESANIETILFELLDGADLVVGIRDRLQRYSESLFSLLARMLWGVSDPLCGMKGYRISKLKSVNSLHSYSSIGTELTIRAVRSGWDIRQVPVEKTDQGLAQEYMLTGLLPRRCYWGSTGRGLTPARNCHKF
jgi:glycosyltransferase involved in cell wall biosynthesis